MCRSNVGVLRSKSRNASNTPVTVTCLTVYEPPVAGAALVVLVEAEELFDEADALVPEPGTLMLWPDGVMIPFKRVGVLDEIPYLLAIRQ